MKQQIDLLNEGFPKEHIEKKGAYSYVSHPFLINNMNRIFGHQNWDIHIIDTPVVVHKEKTEKNGRDRWDVISTAGARLTVKFEDGSVVVKEDYGTCSCQGSNLSDVFNTSFTGSITQAVKRAAHWLGNQFGASLYDGSNPLHSGGKDKWAPALDDSKVADIAKKFKTALAKAASKSHYDKVMADHVGELRDLPEDIKGKMRELAIVKQKTLTEKGANNGK